MERFFIYSRPVLCSRAGETNVVCYVIVHSSGAMSQDDQRPKLQRAETAFAKENNTALGLPEGHNQPDVGTTHIDAAD